MTEEVAKPENVLEETYHSTIASTIWNGKKAIIKKCRRQEDPRTEVRWKLEKDAMARVAGHTHIAELFASDASDLSLVLRFEPGQSLDRLIDAGSKSTLLHSDGELVWRQIASALAYIHDMNIVHDDVKPENIMWSPEQKSAVLIDFGAALDFNELPKDYYNLSGTPSYAAPEYLLKKKSAKGDVWALGVTILFLLRYVPLPDGEWLLPATFEEGTPRTEMLQWLEQVEGLRKEVERSRLLLAEMLAADPCFRISSQDLLQKLQ